MTLNRLLKDLASKGNNERPSADDALDLSKFTRQRWKGNKGHESIVAPLHAIVQALMMVNSSKTKAVRATAAKTTVRVAGGDGDAWRSLLQREWVTDCQAFLATDFKLEGTNGTKQQAR